MIIARVGCDTWTSWDGRALGAQRRRRPERRLPGARHQVDITCDGSPWAAHVHQDALSATYLGKQLERPCRRRPVRGDLVVPDPTRTDASARSVRARRHPAVLDVGARRVVGPADVRHDRDPHPDRRDPQDRPARTSVARDQLRRGRRLRRLSRSVRSSSAPVSSVPHGVNAAAGSAAHRDSCTTGAPAPRPSPRPAGPLSRHQHAAQAIGSTAMIRTARLVLRPVVESDTDRLMEFWNLPEVTRWLLRGPSTAERSARLDRRGHREPRRPQPGRRCWTTCVIGTVNLRLEDGYTQPGGPTRTVGRLRVHLRPGVRRPRLRDRGGPGRRRPRVRRPGCPSGHRRRVRGQLPRRCGSWRSSACAARSTRVRDSWHAELGWIDGCTYALLADER